MSKRVLLDTGPLVAYLCAGDEFHEWAVGQFGQATAPALTCEAVLSEACFLIKGDARALKLLAEFLERGWIQVPFHFASEGKTVMNLMQKYADVPMAFADACLVRLAKRYEDWRVLTLDSDFRVYRKNQTELVPTILPIGR